MRDSSEFAVIEFATGIGYGRVTAVVFPSFESNGNIIFRGRVLDDLDRCIVDIYGKKTREEVVTDLVKSINEKITTLETLKAKLEGRSVSLK